MRSPRKRPRRPLFDEFAEAEVAKGRSLIGLFPAQNDQCKADFAAWKKARGVE
jgi:hypothetical protein